MSELIIDFITSLDGYAAADAVGLKPSLERTAVHV